MLDEDNVWPAKVEQIVFLGAIYDCRLALGDMTLRAQFPRSAVVEVGQLIYVHVLKRAAFQSRSEFFSV